MLKPRAISGFPEWLPTEKLEEERCLGIARAYFESFGYTPLETPAAERKEVLQAKGVADKEIYALSRWDKDGESDADTGLALRFDLTVPTARYVAQHASSLQFPFRRYQMQKVWRGERPQAGRFREFYQCDLDLIGSGDLSPLADAEVLAVLARIFRAFDMGPFVFRVSHRKLLAGLWEVFGGERAQVAEGLRAVDALEKIGRDRAAASLVDSGLLSAEGATGLINRVASPLTRDDLAQVKSWSQAPSFHQAVDTLDEVLCAALGFGLRKEELRVDLSIARGLDYYTGTVFETSLVRAPELGSICSGGRYDDLAGNYTTKKLPGMGASIGLTRLLSWHFSTEAYQSRDNKRSSPAQVLVTNMDDNALATYHRLAEIVRDSGLKAELYLERKKLGAQLKYASQRGIPIALVAGSDEIAKGTVMIKHMPTGQQVESPIDEIADAIAAFLP